MPQTYTIPTSCMNQARDQLVFSEIGLPTSREKVQLYALILDCNTDTTTKEQKTNVPTHSRKRKQVTIKILEYIDKNNNNIAK